LPRVVIGTFLGVAVLLSAVVPGNAQPQPAYQQNGALWNLVRKACLGEISIDPALVRAAGLDAPIRFYFENGKQENLTIADRYCQTELRPDVVFLIGHIIKGNGGYFYKLSPSDGVIIDAITCSPTCGPIRPVRVEGGRKAFSDWVQSDFNSTLERVIENWGR
jgi:hypothetical protein